MDACLSFTFTLCFAKGIELIGPYRTIHLEHLCFHSRPILFQCLTTSQLYCNLLINYACLNNIRYKILERGNTNIHQCTRLMVNCKLFYKFRNACIIKKHMKAKHGVNSGLKCLTFSKRF